MNQRKFAQLKSKMGRPLIIAHRGASAILPENTHSAFQRAIADKADIIEVDLHFTKDDELVIIHDKTLDRTVNGTGLVRNLTLEEIKQYTIKQPPSRKGHVERVPTLQELIESIDGQVSLLLELKDRLFEQAHYAAKLIAILENYDLLENCFVASFNRRSLQTIKKLSPALATAFITLSNMQSTQPTEFLGPLWPLIFLNPFYVSQAHKLGKFVCPLDPTPEARLNLYLRLGVDALITNDPGLTFKEILKRQSLQINPISSLNKSPRLGKPKDQD